MDKMDNIRSVIKEKIHEKHGLKINYPKDCKLLSKSILHITKRQISVSTLKRFFGIIHSPFKPSRYTLDTFAMYLGFKEWQDFALNFIIKKTGDSPQTPWEQLLSATRALTNLSLKSLKAKIGNKMSDFPEREFAINKFDNFLNSPKIATAFIAPGGYGKSTIITQLTEKYFTGANAKFPNDAVCLIDGGIFFNLINRNIEQNKLKNLLEFDLETSYNAFFRQHPKEIKGRFVLIIDGINEIYYQTKQLTHFIENLMTIISSYGNSTWFKLVITCRPDNWKIFSNLFQTNPLLKSKWFDVNYGGSPSDASNVPPLDKSEIKYFLEKKHSAVSFDNLIFHFPKIIEIINNPYLLHLYNISRIQEDIHSDIEVLNRFVHRNILTEPYLEEKSTIINTLLQLSDYGKQNTTIKKEDFPQLTEFHNAYTELISKNILYEYTLLGEYLSVTTYVKFTHHILLGFLLANKWRKENTFDLSLLKKVYKFYENNPQLQRNILMYLIKFAFNEENTEILKKIYSVFEGEKKNLVPLNITQNTPEIINCVAIELRNNKKMRDVLIPFYAKSELGQLFYFESYFDFDSLVLHSGDDIDYYLENKQTTEAKIYGHFMKFMQYFLSGDPINCQKEYRIFQSIELPDNILPIYAGYYYGAQIIYQSLFQSKLDKTLIQNVIQKLNITYERQAQNHTNIPSFEFLLIYCLDFGNQFSENLKLINLVFDRYDISEYSTSRYFQIFYSVYARTLLNTGNTKKGLELFNKIEFKSAQAHHKYYMKLRYYIIKLEFLIFEDKVNDAIKLIDEIKSISHMIRHKFFYDKAVSFEEIIRRNSNTHIPI